MEFNGAKKFVKQPHWLILVLMLVSVTGAIPTKSIASSPQNLTALEKELATTISTEVNITEGHSSNGRKIGILGYYFAIPMLFGLNSSGSSEFGDSGELGVGVDASDRTASVEPNSLSGFLGTPKPTLLTTPSGILNHTALASTTGTHERTSLEKLNPTIATETPEFLTEVRTSRTTAAAMDPVNVENITRYLRTTKPTTSTKTLETSKPPPIMHNVTESMVGTAAVVGGTGGTVSGLVGGAVVGAVAAGGAVAVGVASRVIGGIIGLSGVGSGVADSVIGSGLEEVAQAGFDVIEMEPLGNDIVRPRPAGNQRGGKFDADMGGPLVGAGIVGGGIVGGILFGQDPYYVPPNDAIGVPPVSPVKPVTPISSRRKACRIRLGLDEY